MRDLRAQGLSYREILSCVPVSKSSISLWCRSVELEPQQHRVLQERQFMAGRQGLQTIAALRVAGRLHRRPSKRRQSRHVTTTNGFDLERIRTLYEVERLSVREVAARLGMSFWRVYTLMRNHGVARRHGSDQNYATYKTKPQFQIKSHLTPDEERLRVAGVMLYMAEGAKTRHLVDFTNSDPSLVKVFVKFLREICGVAESRLRVSLYAYANQDMEALNQFWSSLIGIPTSQFTSPTYEL